MAKIYTENENTKTLTTEQSLNASLLRVLQEFVDRISAHFYESLDDTCEAKNFVENLREFYSVLNRRLLYLPRLEYLFSAYKQTISLKSISTLSVNELENKLEEETNIREENLSKYSKITEKILDDFQIIDEETHEKIVRIRLESEENLKSLVERDQRVQEILDEELELKIKEKGDTEKLHEKIEVELRNKRLDLEEQINQTIGNFDRTISKILEEKQKILEQHDEKSEILSDLQIEHEKLEKQVQDIEKEIFEEEQARLAKIQEEFRRERAARTIQRAWHMYKMKKMLKKTRKKGRRKKSPSDESGKKSGKAKSNVRRKK